MTEVSLVGGSDADREIILKLHLDYLDANTRFDWEMLQPIFSPGDDAVYFNLNGFTYQGREHWTNLWKYYGTQVQSSFWSPYDIGGIIDANTAVIWCHRRTRRRWVGSDQPVKDIKYNDQEFLSRSTMVFRKEEDGWRVVHAHFSPGEEGSRPGNV